MSQMKHFLITHYTYIIAYITFLFKKIRKLLEIYHNLVKNTQLSPIKLD